MKIPIKYNPLGNDHGVESGAKYGSRGCFLFRGSTTSQCIESRMTMSNRDLGQGTASAGLLDIFSGGVAVSTYAAGGTCRVSSGGTAVDTELYNSGRISVFSGGTASGVKVQQGCSCFTTSGGVLINADAYAASAGISAFGGTLVSTTLGASRAFLNVSFCDIDGAKLSVQAYATAVSCHASSIFLTEASSYWSAFNGTMEHCGGDAGAFMLSNCQASDFRLGSALSLTLYGSTTVHDLVNEGGYVSLVINGASAFELDGTCTYGTFSANSSMVSGGLWAGVSVLNRGTATDVHIRQGAALYITNRSVVQGAAYVSGGGFTASAYCSASGIYASAGLLSAYIQARSTATGISAAGSLVVTADGTVADASAAYVSANASNGLLQGVSAAMGTVNAFAMGTISNIGLASGAVYVNAYGTASGVSVGSGAVTLTGDCQWQDVTVGTGSIIISNGVLSGFGTLSGGASCRIMTIGSTYLASGTLQGWQGVNVNAYGTLSSAMVLECPLTVGSSATIQDVVVSRGTATSSNVVINASNGVLNGLEVDGYHLNIGGYQTNAIARITHTGEASCSIGSNPVHTAYFGGTSAVLRNGQGCTDITAGAGVVDLISAGVSGLSVLAGATARVQGNSANVSAIDIPDGATVTVYNYGSAYAVHVHSGGSLHCVENGHVYACTSDAGAIVTGSNIEYDE